MAPRIPGACDHGRRAIGDLMHRRIVKTWRTPLQKAAGDEAYQWLHDIADEAEPEVRRKFLEAIQRIRGTPREADLQAALESGDIDRVMAVLGVDEAIQAILAAHLQPASDAVVAVAGSAALDATPATAIRGGSMAMRFDIVNPYTVQAAREQGFNLIRQITDDTRAGIREIVANAMEFGGHPYDQARQIRSLIGLTEFQANAVQNFKRLLEERDREALQRALRDHRFDPTLERALGENPTLELAPEQIDTMVGRYASRMLNFRAETIARTETINASRLGTQEAWRQAAENDWLDHEAIRQGWLVTPDDRLCIYCAAVPAMNPEGVKLGEMFQTPLGEVKGPALHPNCRCIVFLLAF